MCRTTSRSLRRGGVPVWPVADINQSSQSTNDQCAHVFAGLRIAVMKCQTFYSRIRFTKRKQDGGKKETILLFVV